VRIPSAPATAPHAPKFDLTLKIPMSSAVAEAVYERLPVPLQNFVCSAYGRREVRTRFGKEFRRRLDELSESEWWSASDIAGHQDERLRDIVRHAYETVPYYRDRMRELGLTAADIRGSADLPKLPVLTKEEVRANYERMVSTGARKRDLVLRHTSGTTGKALHFYYTRAGIAEQWAVWWRHRRRFGVEWGAPHASFIGKRVVPINQQRPPYWRWNTPMHQALLNMQHLTPTKIRDVVAFLDANVFVYYGGYPSVIHAMAASALEAGLSLARPPRFVFTGAENTLDYQRRDIAALTGATISDQYGFTEGCGNASQCPTGVYHEDFEFGILESVDPRSAGDGRVAGRIVCTGFASPDTPLIRYDVGDTGVWEDPRRACSCGRRSAILTSIEGRRDDYVVTPEGGRIMRFDYLFKDTHNIREVQVVQRELGAIALRIVRRGAYSTRDETLLRDEVRRWISPTLGVSFEYPDEIPRQANGKFQAVVSELVDRRA
jgi:phenylacetate-CoA ligase